MDRRQVLKAGASFGLAWLAGCGEPVADSSSGTLTPAGVETPENASTRDRVRTVAGEELPISQADMARVLPVNGILAIEEPAFGRDWRGLELTYTRRGEEETIYPRLRDDDLVIGIEDEAGARAYPLRVLNLHEIVNDTFDGRPLLITYCPLCGSSMTATREVAGEETVFAVSGLLWKGNLVMYDHLTQTLWSQLSAVGIQGPQWGERLDQYPSEVTSWGDWTERNPDTQVLLPPPHSRTVLADLLDEHSIDRSNDYRQDPYAMFAPPTEDAAEHPFTLVLGIAVDGKAVAYPLPEVRKSGPINDTVGNSPIVVTSAEPRSLMAYSRRIERRAHLFTEFDDSHLQAADTTWEKTTGVAVAGRFEGAELERANSFEPLYLGSWEQYYPDTEVYTADG